MKQKKNVVNIDDVLKIKKDKITQKDIYGIKYKQSMAQARATDNDEDLINKLNIKTGNYSMKTRIMKNPWLNSRPAAKATKWLFQEVFRNPDIYKYNKRMIYQGGLFQFSYLNPKYKGTIFLPWFDKYPLVISLGPVMTKNGPRNIGFNLHLLPPKIRIIVLCAIFELFKKVYRYQIYFKQEKPVQIHYKTIINTLERFGVKFCVRMYIPQRMNQIVRFPLKDWHKAIFIPSRGYDSIKANKLIQEWRKYCRKHKFSTRENIDWKSTIMGK
jgi:hypothetical protein